VKQKNKDSRETFWKLDVQSSKIMIHVKHLIC